MTATRQVRSPLELGQPIQPIQPIQPATARRRWKVMPTPSSPQIEPNYPKRRALVTGAAAAVLAPSLGLWGCTTPLLSDTAGDFARPSTERDYRLANRLSWGATDAELDRVRRLGAPAYINEQLRAAAGPVPTAAQLQIDALRVHHTPPLVLWAEIEAARKVGEAQSTEEARKAAQMAYQQALTRLSREAAHRHLLRAVYSPNQLLERMQWFWFNHFNVHQYKANIRVLLADYEERAIRPHALGRFRDLLGAVSTHPAMLRYLDNDQNAASRINENFARELLELHTLGAEAGYTQRDVQELARVLTGHGVNVTDKAPNVKAEQVALYKRDGIYEFNPNRHDFGDKNLLGHTVKGQGRAELEQVLNQLAMHPATARFVCGKLARHFVSDHPPGSLLVAMSEAWQRSGGHIGHVLAAMLTAPEFTAPTATKFKDPMHFVASAVRACYGERVLLNTTPMQAWLNRMGQGLYNRATPDGYPSALAAWSSSGQIATRLDIARAVGGSSAGLFKADDLASADAARELVAFPQLARPLYWHTLRPQMAPATQQALDMAASPQDWNALYLSAPSFMYT
jgi:uncharacterized protein (DUF1800 family)